MAVLIMDASRVHVIIGVLMRGGHGCASPGARHDAYGGFWNAR